MKNWRKEDFIMIGIFLGLALLMFLAYKGISTIWAAPICAILVAISGGLEPVGTYLTTYMQGFVGFTSSWFPAFMLGAIFGKVMEATGAAHAVGHWIAKAIGAKRAILAVVLACAAMTYGGISLFVAIFVVYPIALPLFREANFPRELIPGCFTLGAFTFTMTALPGSPQIQNLIPMQYMGTTANAAPVLGCVSAVIMFVLGILWLNYRQRKLAKVGIGFVEPADSPVDVVREKIMHPALCFLPLIVVVVLLAILGLNIVVALFAGIVAAILVGFKEIKEKGIVKVINDGALSSMASIINTSAVVGFGSVVKAVPGFVTLTDGLMSIAGSPLIAVAVAVNVLCGATGSASGGLGLSLEALGNRIAALSAQSGIPMETFHRIAALSSGGLDSLPHNGGVVTCLSACGLTHKEAYLDMCMTSVVIPIFTTVIAIILASLGLTF